MRYHQLGKTGIQVSHISLGGSSLGGVYGDIEEGLAIQTVHAALDHGINLIDCAPAYGDLRAETVLGKALNQIQRDRYYLSTKTGKYSGSDFDYSYDRIMQEVEKSLKRLQVDYIDILHLHDFEFQEGVHRDQALSDGIRALQDLRQQGKIGFAGIGIYFVDWCRDVMYNYDIQAMICHNHYTLSDQRLLDLLPDVKTTGVGLISAAPLGMGLLTRAGPADWHPIEPEDLKVFQKAADFCTRAGIPIEKLAVQFGMQNEEIPTTLVSTAMPHEIIQNIEWASQMPDEDLVLEVQKILEPVRNKDWIVG
ncbi:MAG: aldo/keto reductase [Saprospiraceae bacterium]|nr:aldo/keto reductase [Saprospiraceae bacterium]